MAPSYYFTIQPMQPRPHTISRVDGIGRWLPPQGPRDNVSAGQPTLYHHNGLATSTRTEFAGPVSLYRQISVYHERADFWCVELDALTSHVGDGQNTSAGHGSQDEDEDEDEEDEDDDEDEEDEDDDEQDTPPPLPPLLPDWTILTFDRPRHDLSYAGLHKPYPELTNIQPDQYWTSQLLTDTYRAQPTTTQSSHRRGLVGDLPLLLALVALSLQPQHVAAALPACIAVPWRMYTHQQVPRRSGWFNRRGLVVKVFYDPSTTSPQQLQNYEAGGQGAIFP